MRSFMGVIDATLRTGYYQVNDDGSDKDYIGFKFDSARVPDLPKPRPYREIFVYGPRSEEHTSELQSLMRISYAVFCLKKKKQYNQSTANKQHHALQVHK